MSGSGGFYKYRCKYFLTHNCPNWVYANGHACALCLAEGREATETSIASHPSATPWQQQQHQQQHQPHQHQHRQNQHPSSTLTEICVPQAFHGTLRYTVMELVPTDEPSGGAKTYWVLRQKAMEPRSLPLSTITTSDTPRPVMAVVGVGVPVRVGY